MINTEIFFKKYAPKIVGSSMVVCNLFFLTHTIHLFYKYHFSPHFICFIVRLPDTVLFTSAILFSIGLGLGILIFKVKINYLKWSLIDIGIVILVFIIENVSTMYL